LLQESQEAKFTLLKEKQCFSNSVFSSCSSSYSMNVIFWIIWWIVLDDPINIGEVKSSLCYISAQQDSFLQIRNINYICLTVFKICCGSFLLFLFAMNVFDWNINIIEEVRVEFYSIARRHEHHNLLT
jgi:hypothetical protein